MATGGTAALALSFALSLVLVLASLAPAQTVTRETPRTPAAETPAAETPAAENPAAERNATTENPAASGGRPQTLEYPTDFSRPPDLPEYQPLDEAAVAKALGRGVAFMLEAQNPDGSWGSATRTKGLNIYAPVPGAHHAFRAATTALGIAALAELHDGMSSRWDQETLDAIDDSLRRAEDWLIERLPRLRRATGDALYNVWGHGYSIQALVRMHRRYPDDAEKRAVIEGLIRDQMEMLQRYESVDGGWGYYDFRYQAKQPTSSSISFVGGTVLIALFEADQLGITPPERLVRRAIAAIHRQQKPDFTYLYGEYLQYQPMRGINRPGGSLARSQCCNLALRVWGDEAITDHVIEHWLTRLYLRNGWLDIGRKRPIPHEAWFQVAGYFYYYGHYYAALSLAELPPESRAPYRAMLAELLLPHQEANGAWWDYPLYNYHEPYGTAFALMTLLRCLPEGSGLPEGPGMAEPSE